MSRTNYNEVSAEKDAGGVKRVLDNYATGKPLYSRSVLVKLDRDLDARGEMIMINDYFDVPQECNLVPSPCLQAGATPTINWASLQALTILHPEFGSYSDKTPISICFVNHGDEGQNVCHSKESVKRFNEHQEKWLQSETHASLKRFLENSSFATPIHKIVAFGLGRLGSERSNFQHAALKTMATSLGERFGCDVRCFSQEPAYSYSDKLFLESTGVTVLMDPKGFLEVDEHTLVMTVSPNIPVKQIVADIQWPAAMLWNTVQSEAEEEHKYKKVFEKGDHSDYYWVAPFTTDPDSPRVRDMVKQYYQEPFSKDPGCWAQFGNLTLYVKKEST